MFRKWIGTSRYVYNRALKATKDGEKMNFMDLRNKYVTSKNNPNVKDWELETPKDIRAEAVNDVVKAFKTAMSNLKNNNIDKFDLQYRKKKKESSIVIPYSAIQITNRKIFIYKKYSKENIKLSKDKALLNIKLEHDCRLKNDNGKWYLYIPYKEKINMKTPKKEICALDPGTRKFQTIYSEDVTIKIGIKKEQVKKLQTKIDLLQSLRSKKLIRKCHFTQKINKAQFRVKNLVDELHYQTINYLTKTFKMIFIPKFESQELVRINKSKKFRRDLLSLRHYTFKERLIAKSKLQKDCCVEVCTEEYTSKTCTNCGKINNVGSSEVYHCNYCNLTIDRDINGARNIFIKQVKETENELQRMITMYK
jgi:putative transposase